MPNVFSRFPLRVLAAFLIASVLLSPLGQLCEWSAWGEWEPQEFAQKIGFVPQGMREAIGWSWAPFGDYTLFGIGGGVAYIANAAIGTALVIAFFYLLRGRGPKAKKGKR